MPLNSTTSHADADRSPREMSDRPSTHAGLSAGVSEESALDHPVPATAAAQQRQQPHGAPPPASGGKTLQIPKIKTGLPLRKRPQEVRRIAIEVFPAADSWVVFYREILGVDGVVRKLFKSVDETRYWESTDEFLEIQEMLTALRSTDAGKGDSVEPQRMITVRLPTSLHESLKVEAEEHQTSMNKLCMSKLLMSISDRFVPTESGRIRGRKPGPQGKRKPAAEQQVQSELQTEMH